jgi:hypothetical protein
MFGRRFFSLKLRQTFLYEVGDVAEEKVDFPNVTLDSARIKGNVAMGFSILIVVIPCMLTITQLLLQQNAHFYY